MRGLQARCLIYSLQVRLGCGFCCRGCKALGCCLAGILKRPKSPGFSRYKQVPFAAAVVFPFPLDNNFVLLLYLSFLKALWKRLAVIAGWTRKLETCGWCTLFLWYLKEQYHYVIEVQHTFLQITRRFFSVISGKMSLLIYVTAQGQHLLPVSRSFFIQVIQNIIK